MEVIDPRSSEVSGFASRVVDFTAIGRAMARRVGRAWRGWRATRAASPDDRLHDLAVAVADLG
jgi:hypothetical protein